MRRWFVSSFVAVAVTAAVPANAALASPNEAGVGFPVKVIPGEATDVNVVDSNGDDIPIGHTDSTGSGYANLAEASTGGKTAKYDVQIVKCGDVPHIDLVRSGLTASGDDGCDRKDAGGWVFGSGKPFVVNLQNGVLVQGGGHALEWSVGGGVVALAGGFLALKGNGDPAATVSGQNASVHTPVPTVTFNWSTLNGQYTGFANFVGTPCGSFPALSTVAVQVQLNQSGTGTIQVQFFGGVFSQNVTASGTSSSAASISGSGNVLLSGKPYNVTANLTNANQTASGKIVFTSAGSTPTDCVGTYNITLNQTATSQGSK